MSSRCVPDRFRLLGSGPRVEQSGAPGGEHAKGFSQKARGEGGLSEDFFRGFSYFFCVFRVRPDRDSELAFSRPTCGCKVLVEAWKGGGGGRGGDCFGKSRSAGFGRHLCGFLGFFFR